MNKRKYIQNWIGLHLVATIIFGVITPCAFWGANSDFTVGVVFLTITLTNLIFMIIHLFEGAFMRGDI